MQSDPDELLIQTERLRSVFHQAPLTLLVTVINAGLTAVVLAPAIDHTLLWIWTGLIVAVSIVRAVILQVFRSRRPEGAQCRPWAVASVLGSLATGALWGIGATALFPAAETYQLFIAFVVGGMCAGATTVNSAHLPTVLAFILPASLPLAGSFLAGHSAPRVVSAMLIVVFASALSLTSLRAHRAFGERIRLQLELGRQRRELSDANDRLRAEMLERQTAEASLHQAQKMEAIGHLTGGVAHDFNNLLTVVIGSMDLIRRMVPDNDRVIGYAAAAYRAAERGARLTNSLLAFARRQSLRTEQVNLNALLREFEPILLRAVGDAIRYETTLDPDLPDCHADPAHFQSAMLNLVINARDAMPEGGRLSVATGAATLGKEELSGNPDAKPGRFVSVSVRDYGSGMGEEALARAFEPFFTTKEVGQGSGLGLSQIYGFARQSGGLISLHSALGAGTCATLWLPVADGTRGSPKAEEEDEGRQLRAPVAGITALVVEDDPDVLEIVSACLASADYRVQAAATAHEALEILSRGGGVRFLLADVALQGGLSGVELARRARAIRPDLPITLATGHAAAALAAHGVVEGEFRLLRKPFRLNELLACVGEATAHA